MSEQQVGDGAAQVARELGDIRQRGLEELELHGSSQKPRQTPAVDRLARHYCTASGVVFHGRIAQIRKLLQDGLAVYAERGNTYESQLLSLVFFDPAEQQADTRRRPGVRLEAARQRHNLDAGRFKLYLDTLFTSFAEFLIAFVAEARTIPELPGTGSAAATIGRVVTTPHRPRRLRLLGAAAVVLIISATAVIVAQHWDSTTIRPSPTPTLIGLPPGGKTYDEQAGEYGSMTFTDPYHPAPTDSRVGVYQWVKVSCKVFAPTMPNMTPDGYWYRLAGPLWNNRYYTIAKNFMNGDPIGGPYLHNTDFGVPDCPR